MKIEQNWTESKDLKIEIYCIEKLCKCENASDVRPKYNRQAKLKIVMIFDINKNYEFLWLWMTKIKVIFLFTVVSRFWNSNTSAIEFVETTSKNFSGWYGTASETMQGPLQSMVKSQDKFTKILFFCTLWKK